MRDMSAKIDELHEKRLGEESQERKFNALKRKGYTSSVLPSSPGGLRRLQRR